MHKILLLMFLATMSVCFSGCEAKNSPIDGSASSSGNTKETGVDRVWAINVGGPAYLSVDGTRYESESSVVGGSIGQMNVVKGSQDPFLYQTYRAGDIQITKALASGTYDITFHFAEPEDVQGGERVFDTFVGDELVIEKLDVMASRDGKVDSALTVTVPNVAVTDGVLDIRFDASTGQPMLNALVVRSKNRAVPDWRLTWNDEFDAASLDAKKWSFNIWPARKVNDEDQAYTSRETNVRLEDGKLIIEAHKEDYQNAKYSSGRVHSSGKGDLLYGRVEVRAKLPRGKGSWPAIWMLPSDPFRYATTCEAGADWQGSGDCNAWPNSGEIDIMEHVGYQMGHVHGTVHNEAYYWAKWEQRKGRILIGDVDQSFHIYAMEWTPDRIDVFVDDTLYFSYMNENTGWEVWPYDQPFHLILNIAVGGMWGRSGGGIDDDIFPQRMEIDYVRVFESVQQVAEVR